MAEIPHVFVCTPAYDGKVDSDFAQSLGSAAQAATIFGIRVQHCVMGNGAFIELARNIFVKMFLDHNRENPDDAYTHLFFIDADLKFDSRGFVNLIRAGKPVTSGAYRRRQEPEDYPVKWVPHPETSKEKGQDCLWIEDDHWLQCNRVASGFLCIERQVIDEMAADAVGMKIQGQNGLVPQLFYTKLTDSDPPSFMGEDFCWCDDYTAKYNRNIDVLMDIDFVHGGYRCNYYRWLEKQVHAYNEANGIAEKETRKLGDRRKARAS